MKLLHIKWERILVLIYSIFYVIKLVSHIRNYGFDFESDMTIFIIICILLFIVYMLTLSLRRTLIERNKKDE